MNSSALFRVLRAANKKTCFRPLQYHCKEELILGQAERIAYSTELDYSTCSNTVRVNDLRKEQYHW